MRCLETPKELAARVGVPVSAVRSLIKAQQLDHIFLTPGRRNPKIPLGAWERCIEENMVKACVEESSIHTSKETEKTPKMGTGTYFGQNKAEAAASAQLVREIARKRI